MADYCVWNLCNSNCIMCTNPYGFRNKKDAKEYSAEKVIERIMSEKEKLRETGEDITLTGGEPTIHPKILHILKKLREVFPKNRLAFASNGRRLIYEDFTKELLKINNLRVHVAVHSAQEEVHDGITRTPGSFKQVIKGLENLFKYRNGSQMIELRTVLLKQNYKDIDDIYQLFYNKFPSADRISTIFPEYEGRAEENFDSIKISYPEVKPYIEEAVETWGDKFSNFYLYHFPLCVVDPKYWEHVVRSLPPDHDETAFLDKCDKCFYKEACLSVYKDYVSHFGEDHFEPIKSKLENIEKRPDNYHYPIKINK